MRSWLLVLGIGLLIPSSVTAQVSSAGQAPPPALVPGKILPSVQCSAQPEQSYALYLPSNYSRARAWPLIVSSDPGARGTVPLELQREAAERLGYVLAASNNSRNGPWKPRLEATEATLNDLQARVSIDKQRLYFAGFSGGARASSLFASRCKCSAGVLLSGAGFSEKPAPAKDSPFPVFLAIGILDFNYKEMVPLQDALRKTGYPCWLRVFEGTHQWPPAEVMEEALAWFRIQAMKSQREPLDRSFVDAQFSKAVARAQSLEESHDLLGAWRDYVQITGTYDPLVDVGAIRAKAEALEKDKAVRDALKREKSEFDEQSRLTSEISSRLEASQQQDDGRFAAGREMRQQLLQLRLNAKHEKRPEQARVYQRALGEVFIMAMESGDSLVAAKKFPEALLSYDCATQARPESEWAWRQLAVAWALSGDRKEAIKALRQAAQAAPDKAQFARWLEGERAFDSLRSTPEFQGLVHSN
jgi:dienelactone hydrolase